VKLTKVPLYGKNGTFHVVVESPRGSPLKLKYDPDLGVITLSRPLTLGLTYPFDWGFVPSTAGEDGDPVDAMIVWYGISFPGVVIPCRLLGLVEVEQDKEKKKGRERNDRIIAVPAEDHRCKEMKTVLDLPERVRAEIAIFFLESTAFEAKNAEILGWRGPVAARALIKRSRER